MPRHAKPETQIEIVQRRKKVVANILGGMTYQEIADLLGVSKATVARDFKAVLREWQSHYVKDTDKWTAIQLRKLDVMMNAIWDRAQNGDLHSIDRMMHLLERQAKLLGLDKPQTVGLTLSPQLMATLNKLGITVQEVFHHLETELQTRLLGQ